MSAESKSARDLIHSHVPFDTKRATVQITAAVAPTGVATQPYFASMPVFLSSGSRRRCDRTSGALAMPRARNCTSPPELSESSLAMRAKRSRMTMNTWHFFALGKRQCAIRLDNTVPNTEEDVSTPRSCRPRRDPGALRSRRRR